MARAFIGIGSNLGDRQAHVQLAVERLSALTRTTLVALSPVYETDPVGGPAGQGRYLNAVAELRTLLEPRELLQGLQGIELETGRRRAPDDPRWGPRTLDLDILLYDDRVLYEPGLMIPHPRMHEREFVLRPLADLDPSALHPVLETTAGHLLRQITTPHAHGSSR